MSSRPSNPRVSVIVTTYNRADYLSRAVESVLSQRYRNFELIVVDDGSIDETPEIVSRFQGSLEYVYQTNQGRAQARNTGLARAKGKYVALLDSDDLWLPDRLERGVRFLDTAHRYGLVHGAVEIIDARGHLVKEETANLKKFYERERKRHCDYLLLLRHYAIFSSTVLFRRDCLERVGFYDTVFPVVEDYDWYLRFSLHYSIHCLEAPPLAQYRLHEGNVSARYDSEEIARIYIEILKKQLTQIAKTYSGKTHRKFRSQILAKLAEFQATDHRKSEVRATLLEALQLNPAIALDGRSLKRLVLSLF